MEKMKIFDPKECPAFDRGRWYHAFIESDGTAWKLTQDGGIVDHMVNSGIHIKDDFTPVDVVTIPHYTVANKDFMTVREPRMATDGHYFYPLGSAAVSSVDYADVYIFARKE